MQVFVARQPIFDRRQRVYAYELLFRSGIDNYFDHPDANHASSKVITDSFLAIGIEKLTGGKKAFVNFTTNLLLKEYATLFPNQLTVVELLETVDPNPGIISACQKLKQLGYLLALDDFVDKKRLDPLIDLADIIKVDFIQTPMDEKRRVLQKFGSRGLSLLAEKVEVKDEFDQAMEMGYTYFQGYFFSEPTIISGRDVPGFKRNYLHILREIGQAKFDFGRIESIIKRDVSLSYKLLKYINSALFGLRRPVASIRQALVLLGEHNVKKWIALIALSGMGEDKPMELISLSIIRAKFCELIAVKIGLSDRSQDLFLLGLFSMMDAIIDRPMSEILAELPISEDVKRALLGEDNRFRDIYQSILAYEQGNWEKFSEFAAKLRLDEIEVPDVYQQSVLWANQISDVG